MQDDVGDHLRDKQADEFGLLGGHAPARQGRPRLTARLGDPDRLGRERPFPRSEVVPRGPHHDDGHVVIDVPRHRLLRRLGDRLDAGPRHRADRAAEHLHRLRLGVVAGAIEALPPVGEAVGVEDQGGPRWELACLLPVGRQARYAFAAHPQQDSLVLDL